MVENLREKQGEGGGGRGKYIYKYDVYINIIST